MLCINCAGNQNNKTRGINNQQEEYIQNKGKELVGVWSLCVSGLRDEATQIMNQTMAQIGGWVGVEVWDLIHLRYETFTHHIHCLTFDEINLSHSYVCKKNYTKKHIKKSKLLWETPAKSQCPIVSAGLGISADLSSWLD